MKPLADNFTFIPPLVLLFTIMISTGCEKSIPFPKQDVQPQLVINGNFTPDSTWMVHISESAAVNGSDQPRNVAGADVRLMDESGNTIANFEHDKEGFYHILNLYPEEGRTYRIEASAPGFATATSQSYQPRDFSFSLLDTSHSIFLDMPVVFIDLEIADNLQESNYYFIEIQKTITITDTQETYTFIPYHYVFDQNTENDEIDTESSGFERVYLPDQAFNGEKYTTRFAAEKDEDEENGSDGIQSEWLVRVSSVSEDLYKYGKTLERYHISNGELFAEPVEIYTNINKGLGVFGGYVTREQIIRF